MNLRQKKFIALLKEETKKLYIEGEVEYLDKVNDVLMALIDENTVIAVILAEIHDLPERMIREMKVIFEVKRVS